MIKIVEELAKKDGIKGLKIKTETGDLIYNSSWIAGVDYDEQDQKSYFEDKVKEYIDEIDPNEIHNNNPNEIHNNKDNPDSTHHKEVHPIQLRNEQNDGIEQDYQYQEYVDENNDLNLEHHVRRS